MSTATSARSVRRRVAQLVVAASLGALVTAAPVPVLAEVTEARTRSEVVALQSAAGDRTGDRVAATEAAELRAALAEPHRRTARRATETFQAIGLTLAEAPPSPVLVRARQGDTWTPWYEAHLEGDAPDAGGEGARPGLHSAPVWVGDAEAYEVDAPPEVGEVQVHLVREVVVDRQVAITEPNASAAGAPTIQPRSAWGARAPRTSPAYVGDLRAAVVHHSVSANGYSASQVPGILRSIQAYHQDVNGWNDIAYNFAVDRFGRTWEARAGGIDRIVLGGHAKGFNTGTVGVVVLGDFTATSVPGAAVEAVAHVVAWKFAIHRVDPASTVPVTSAGSSKYPEGVGVTLRRVVGHRDLQSTGCPGAGIYSRLGTIRTRVAQLVPGYQADALPDLLSGDHTGDGLADPLEYRPGSSSDTLWRSTALGTFAKRSVRASGAYRTAVGDFDGNGYDDVLWHGTGSTPDSIWWATASGFRSEGIRVSGSYMPVVGDFDGNGYDDVHWYSPGLSADYMWYFLADGTWSSQRADQDLSTGVPLVGAFDGVPGDDLFWYGPGPDADDELWLSRGTSFVKTDRSVRGYYSPVVGDADGNGADDIVWVQPGAPTSYRWDFLPGSPIVSRTLSTPPPAGAAVAGDFNGDGAVDVFTYAPGSAPDAFWYSTPDGVEVGTARVSGTYVVATGPMDRPAGAPVTDDLLFVSLGADYLWRNGAGHAYTSSQVG